MKWLDFANSYSYMMHRKGLLFAPDSTVTAQILAPNGPVADPRKLKSLGRKVPNFDDKIWHRERFNIVVEGNYQKFSQNPKLKRQLLGTGTRELVEASPRDRIWGVGFGAKNAPKNRSRWGLNLLGKALMEVRERLRKEEAGEVDAEDPDAEDSVEDLDDCDGDEETPHRGILE